MVFYLLKTIQIMVKFSYRAKNDSWAEYKRVKRSGSGWHHLSPDLFSRPVTSERIDDDDNGW